MTADAASPRKAADNRTGVQYAALPYRVAGGTVEILLVTSLTTRRWIIPKGWPIAGRPPHACAAHEALEEAGVDGEIGNTPIGRYRYFKLLKSGARVPCQVEVFALKVAHEAEVWPEKGARERRWCTVAEAATAVDEIQLKRMILKFGERMTEGRGQPG